MKFAFDTSVLVAGLVESHEHFERAAPWLDALGDGRIEAHWTVHAYAEAWSVLTRLPLAQQLAPDEVGTILDQLCGLAAPIALPLVDYQAAAERCAAAKVRSGVVFDALHLVSAEAAGVRALLTFNERDFARLKPRIPIIVPALGDRPGE